MHIRTIAYSSKEGNIVTEFFISHGNVRKILLGKGFLSRSTHRFVGDSPSHSPPINSLMYVVPQNHPKKIT